MWSAHFPEAHVHNSRLPYSLDMSLTPAAVGHRTIRHVHAGDAIISDGGEVCLQSLYTSEIPQVVVADEGVTDVDADHSPLVANAVNDTLELAQAPVLVMCTPLARVVADHVLERDLDSRHRLQKALHLLYHASNRGLGVGAPASVGATLLERTQADLSTTVEASLEASTLTERSTSGHRANCISPSRA